MGCTMKAAIGSFHSDILGHFFESKSDRGKANMHKMITLDGKRA